MKTVFFGPFVGEFGWEMLYWHAWVNKVSKNKLYVAQKKICNGCEVEFLERNLTVDHKFPRSKGGQNFIDNLQLLCGARNSVKGDRPMSYLLEKNKKVRELLEFKISFK